MKKSLIIVGVVLLLFALCACRNNSENENNAEEESQIIGGLANPMVEKDSLNTINSEIGTKIVKPTVMGVSDEKFYVINNEIAQYSFTVNGYDWTIRGAKNTKEDISGINSEYNVFEEGVPSVLYLNDYYIERYFDGEYQYTFVVDKPEGFSEEIFGDVVLELERMISYDEIIGDYVDTASKRATAVVEKVDGYFNVLVSWADSANKTTEWLMVCTKEDGKLTYAGENMTSYEYDAEGNLLADATPTVSNNIGYFEIVDGKLLWTGAALENCRSCVFEKVIQD